jgi:hypothetical protein
MTEDLLDAKYMLRLPLDTCEKRLIQNLVRKEWSPTMTGIIMI